MAEAGGSGWDIHCRRVLLIHLAENANFFFATQTVGMVGITQAHSSYRKSQCPAVLVKTLWKREEGS